MNQASPKLPPGLYHCHDLPGWWCRLRAPASTEGYAEVDLIIPSQGRVLVHGYVTASHLDPAGDWSPRQQRSGAGNQAAP
jgi:hypothetical protein